MPHTAKSVHSRNLDRTWIVVADGGAARILAVAPDHTHLVSLHDITSPDMHRKTHDMVTDRPGRSFESATPGRHAIAAKTDPHEQAKERFVHGLGVTLNQHRAAGDFDVLVLAVTRAQVHELEEALDAGTKACVASRISKDLVKTSNADIWARLIEDGVLPPRPTAPRPGGL